MVEWGNINRNSFNSIVGYGKIVGIGGTNTAGVGRPRDYYVYCTAVEKQPIMWVILLRRGMKRTYSQVMGRESRGLCHFHPFAPSL